MGILLRGKSQREFLLKRKPSCGTSNISTVEDINRNFRAQKVRVLTVRLLIPVLADREREVSVEGASPLLRLFLLHPLTNRRATCPRNLYPSFPPEAIPLNQSTLLRLEEIPVPRR